jgi:acyl carrier protein
MHELRRGRMAAAAAHARILDPFTPGDDMVTEKDADIETPIREFILAEFLLGEDPALLTPTTPLLTSGVLDSIATLKLVTFLEERFQIKIISGETDEYNFDTVGDMVRLVRAKRGAN